MRENIVFYCSGNSPSFDFLPEDIYGRGIGGAEQSLCLVAEALMFLGYRVTVYNRHSRPEPIQVHRSIAFIDHRRMEYRPSFNDTLVIFRVPDFRFKGAGKTIWWSTDQLTSGNYTDFARTVDDIVVISEYHRDYMSREWGIEKEQMRVFDLPVAYSRYSYAVNREDYSAIFCSVPHRGLWYLLDAWPELKDVVKSLTITSDYTLWGGTPDNDEYRQIASGLGDVRFLGNIPKRELIDLQLSRWIFPYPHHSYVPSRGGSVHVELFCVSVAECQAAGCVPITTATGALATTNEGGLVVDVDVNTSEGLSRWIEAVLKVAGDPALWSGYSMKCRTVGNKRFTPQVVARKWATLL